MKRLYNFLFVVPVVVQQGDVAGVQVSEIMFPVLLKVCQYFALIGQRLPETHDGGVSRLNGVSLIDGLLQRRSFESSTQSLPDVDESVVFHKSLNQDAGGRQRDALEADADVGGGEKTRFDHRHIVGQMNHRQVEATVAGDDGHDGDVQVVRRMVILMGIEGFEAICHVLDVLQDGRIGSHHEGDAPPQVIGCIHEGVDVVAIVVDVLQRVLIELLVVLVQIHLFGVDEHGFLRWWYGEPGYSDGGHSLIKISISIFGIFTSVSHIAPCLPQK